MRLRHRRNEGAAVGHPDDADAMVGTPAPGPAAPMDAPYVADSGPTPLAGRMERKWEKAWRRRTGGA